MITSVNNQTVANAARLKEKKYRVQTGKYLIEGDKLVSDALRYAVVIETLFLTQDKSQFAAQSSAERIIVADNVMDKISDTLNGQGVVAVASLPDLSLKPPSQGNDRALVLDRLQDPGNLGTILRTASATGYNEVYLYDCVDAFSPKVIRSGMAGQFCLHIHTGSIEEIVSLLKQSGMLLVCADMDGENIFSAQVCPRHALIVGNEGNGLSDFARNSCDKKVSLPMLNNFESLNAGVSAGVIMYELTNRR